MAGIADDYARELDRLEERAEANTIALLRTSLANVLRDLRRSYSQYLETLGPLEEDPAGNPIRRPGAYTAGESAVKFRAILRDASGFLNDTELQAWQAQFEQDLRQATELGGRIGQDLSELVLRPDEVVPFTGADPLVVRTAAAISGAYIQGEGARFRDQIVQIVGEGASRGWGPKRLELGIREALEGAADTNGITQRMGLKQRAALIARSELANAYVRATIERSQRQGFSYVRALASNDERVCPICASRNGRVYPADRIAMPWHPRCVLGDTHVSPGLLAAVIRSRYRGDVVTVGLESGERLTVTANHPMLTPSGWVKAETLRHGDQLVGHGLHRTRSIVGEAPDLHQMPATAEDVFAAFSNSGTVTTVSVPVTPLDLHGDGAFIEGNVDVVRADGLLECYRDVEGLNAASQEAGIIGGVRFRPFASLSYADAGLLWHAATAAGSMSRLREAQALLRGGLSHAEQHRIATTAWRDPVLVQELGDGVALYAKALRHGLDAAAFLECPECGSLVEDQAVSSERQASRGQVTPDDTGGDAIGSGDSGSAQAGLVEIHKVASIEINPFHGFVYTFETFSGAYSIGADSRILTQNCRCVAVPVTNEAVTETDPESREVLLDNDRWRKEHDRGVEVYAKGRHKQKIETLRRQVDRAKDGDRKDQLSAQLDRLIERGPDIVKARTELAQALKTPSASERRLFGKGTKALQESVPLYPPR